MTTAAPPIPLTGSGKRAPFEGNLGELVELWRRVDELSALPDPSDLSGDRALAAAKVIASVRHATDTLLAPYAARIDALSDPSRTTRFARWKGFPNAAALLSHFTGLSVAEAGKLIGLGRALADAVEAPPAPPDFEGGDEALPFAEEPAVAPEPGCTSPTAANNAPLLPTVPLTDTRPSLSPLAAAIRAGTLGTEKANIIRRTLEDMTIDSTDAEAFLVERALSMDITPLRRLCLETLAALDGEGLAQREARQRKGRFLKIYEEPDGMVTVFAKLDAASAAFIKSWCEAEMQAEVFSERDLRPVEQRSIGQIMADVFVSMARHATGCNSATTRPKSTLVIRASEESLRTGQGFATCDGIEAPLTISTALAMAVDAEIVPLVLGAEGIPLKIGRAKRRATSAQRLAVYERDRGCAKCSLAISRCDAHHIREWSKDGPTDTENLVMLCVGCHHRIHDFGWGIVVEDNAVWFIPPAHEDPLRRRQPGSSARLAA